ncbi:hypothetical protein DLE60_11805 [Micromonospora globispora]|nr:hypothetical protein DLE60_11805 [Micromonospora globispora]
MERPALFDAVLLDRDGTLIEDVPYNGDPEKVRPFPGVREALDRLRAAGVRLAVVTNQSGLARGYFTSEQMRAVHQRVEELLGPFDDWQICPHDDTDGCACRKPAPGMVHAAARTLGTSPGRCVMVGDIGRDMTAALAAGPDAHPDPDRRWIASVTAGVGMALLGLGAGAATALVLLSPPILVEAVAGLALLGALAGAVSAAVADPDAREAAVVTFVVTASGVSLLGVGGAFWGLVAGWLMLLLFRRRGAGHPADGDPPAGTDRPDGEAAESDRIAPAHAS